MMNLMAKPQPKKATKPTVTKTMATKLTTTKFMATMALTSALLVGCSSTTNINTEGELSYETLENNKWQLVEATDSNGNILTTLFTQPANPLILNFVQVDGRNILSLDNTCNHYSAHYQVVNNDIELGNFATTMKACPPQQASFDSAAANVVMGNYTLEQSKDGTAMLTVSHDDSIARFRAMPKL